MRYWVFCFYSFWSISLSELQVNYNNERSRCVQSISTSFGFVSTSIFIMVAILSFSFLFWFIQCVGISQTQLYLQNKKADLHKYVLLLLFFLKVHVISHQSFHTRVSTISSLCFWVTYLCCLSYDSLGMVMLVACMVFNLLELGQVRFLKSLFFFSPPMCYLIDQLLTALIYLICCSRISTGLCCSSFTLSLVQVVLFISEWFIN